jgi:hypothetical protein
MIMRLVYRRRRTSTEFKVLCMQTNQHPRAAGFRVKVDWQTVLTQFNISRLDSTVTFVVSTWRHELVVCSVCDRKQCLRREKPVGQIVAAKSAAAAAPVSAVAASVVWYSTLQMRARKSIVIKYARLEAAELFSRTARRQRFGNNDVRLVRVERGACREMAGESGHATRTVHPRH